MRKMFLIFLAILTSCGGTSGASGIGRNRRGNPENNGNNNNDPRPDDEGNNNGQGNNGDIPPPPPPPAPPAPGAAPNWRENSNNKVEMRPKQQETNIQKQRRSVINSLSAEEQEAFEATLAIIKNRLETTEKQTDEKIEELEEQIKASNTIVNSWKIYKAKKKLNKLKKEKEEREQAAINIQKYCKGYLVRKKIKEQAEIDAVPLRNSQELGTKGQSRDSVFGTNGEETRQTISDINDRLTINQARRDSIDAGVLYDNIPVTKKEEKQAKKNAKKRANQQPKLTDIKE